MTRDTDTKPLETGHDFISTKLYPMMRDDIIKQKEIFMKRKGVLKRCTALLNELKKRGLTVIDNLKT